MPTMEGHPLPKRPRDIAAAREDRCVDMTTLSARHDDSSVTNPRVQRTRGSRLVPPR